MPRPTTGIRRRAKLWPAAINALAVAIERRPETNKTHVDELVFVTEYGNSWYKDVCDSPGPE